MSEIKEQIVEQATHLLDWLPGAYDHCKYGSREWCDGYLSNAVEVIQSPAARITVLEEALRPFAEAPADWTIYTVNAARLALNATPQDGKGGEEW